MCTGQWDKQLSTVGNEDCRQNEKVKTTASTSTSLSISFPKLKKSHLFFEESTDFNKNNIVHF